MAGATHGARASTAAFTAGAGDKRQALADVKATLFGSPFYQGSRGSPVRAASSPWLRRSNRVAKTLIGRPGIACSIFVLFIPSPCAVSMAGGPEKNQCGSCKPPSRVAQLLARNSGTVSLSSSDSVEQASGAINSAPKMVWIPGGEFTMGMNETQSYGPERPVHRVWVDGFWMDESEVTNAEFVRFVEATSYVTTAERKPDWVPLRTPECRTSAFAA